MVVCFPVSGRDPSKFQHQGFGMLLMEEAERIAVEEHGSYKISVISGLYRNISIYIVSIVHYKHKRQFNIQQVCNMS